MSKFARLQAAYDNMEPPDYGDDPEVTDEHRAEARKSLMEDTDHEDITDEDVERLARKYAGFRK